MASCGTTRSSGGGDSRAAGAALALACPGILAGHRCIFWRSTKPASTSCCGLAVFRRCWVTQCGAQRTLFAASESPSRRRIARWNGCASRKSFACLCCIGGRWRGGDNSASIPAAGAASVNRGQATSARCFRGNPVAQRAGAARSLLPGIQDADEIIVVDNGSDEGTAVIWRVMAIDRA